MSIADKLLNKLTRRGADAPASPTSWGPAPGSPRGRRGGGRSSRPAEATRWVAPEEGPGQAGALVPDSPLTTPPLTTHQIGEVIDGLYEVQARLGGGGMGEVWKVHHRTWGISLAMKEVRPELVADERARRAFMREAESWVNLPLHPNIVTCYYVRQSSLNNSTTSDPETGQDSPLTTHHSRLDHSPSSPRVL